MSPRDVAPSSAVTSARGSEASSRTNTSTNINITSKKKKSKQATTQPQPYLAYSSQSQYFTHEDKTYRKFKKAARVVKLVKSIKTIKSQVRSWVYVDDDSAPPPSSHTQADYRPLKLLVLSCEQYWSTNKMFSPVRLRMQPFTRGCMNITRTNNKKPHIVRCMYIFIIYLFAFILNV